MTDRAANPQSLMPRDGPGTLNGSLASSVGANSAPGPSSQGQSQIQASPRLNTNQSASSAASDGPSRLPSIPTLPPIQIPRNTLHPSPSSAPDGGLGAATKGASSLRADDPQPSSTRSEDSFATARTSDSPSDVAPPDTGSTAFTARGAQGPSSASPASPPPPPPLSGSGSGTLRTLPKSLSVDSFHREQRQQRDGALPDYEASRASSPGSKAHSRLSTTDPPAERPATSSGISVSESVVRPAPPPLPLVSVPSTSSTSTSRISVSAGIRTLAQRVRRRSRHGHGGSFAEEEENESSAHDDSEFEQGRSSSTGPGGKMNNSNVAGKASEAQTPSRRRLVPPKRSGSMPSSRSPIASPAARNRKGTVGAHPTLPSINTAIAIAQTNVVTDSPSLRSKASAPTPLDTSRSRSHSIGAQSDESIYKRSKMQASTSADIDRPPVSYNDYFSCLYAWLTLLQKDAITMTLAVVGTQGCGKTSFIRRAWKFFRVSEPELQSVTAKDPDGHRVIHCKQSFLIPQFRRA